jgi:hypothetical protein
MCLQLELWRVTSLFLVAQVCPVEVVSVALFESRGVLPLVVLEPPVLWVATCTSWEVPPTETLAVLAVPCQCLAVAASRDLVVVHR